MREHSPVSPLNEQSNEKALPLIHNTFYLRGATTIILLCGCIHFDANISVILKSFQWLRPFAPRDNLEPPTYLYWDIPKPHPTSSDANEHNACYHLLLPQLAQQATPSSQSWLIPQPPSAPMPIRIPPTRYDASISKSPKTYGTIGQESALLPNRGI